MKLVLAAPAVLALALALSGAGSARPAARTYSPLDEQFLQNEAQGSAYEVAFGHMLVRRATTPALRAFGTRLVTDHGRDLSAVRALARPLGISLAPKPNPVQQWALNEIGEESGADFDRDATELAIGDHKMDIHDAKTEKAHGMNARIRAFAAASLTQLRLHLRIAEQTRKAQLR